jgi:TusA-related sulfurtransferase
MVDIKIDTTQHTCATAEIMVDCRGQTCPVPLVEVRKALKRAKPGEVIEVVGTHPASKKEIPMAVTALKAEVLSIEGSDSDWKIMIRR